MKIRILLLLTSLCFLASCGGDDVDCTDTTALNSTIASATNTLNAAITAWNGSDQMEESCKALRDAYEDYIDAFEDIQDCATDLPGLILNARKEQERLSCN